MVTDKELNDRLIERDQTSEFSWDAWKKCAKLGIQGLPIPSEYGGGDADCVTMLPKTSTGKIDRVTLAKGVRPVAV
jgi:alkylation response protein AidB-like acyl-CoA dehydrogenase